jgi:hypothetical protein
MEKHLKKRKELFKKRRKKKQLSTASVESAGCEGATK